MASDFECGSVKCDADALWRCAWPGKETDLCSHCTAWAVKVADTLGFRLRYWDLTPIKADQAARELRGETPCGNCGGYDCDCCQGCGESGCAGSCIY